MSVGEHDRRLADALREAIGWQRRRNMDVAEIATELAVVREERDRLRDALAWYAERRNYVPPAPDGLHAYDAMMATDSYDGNGPGARARAALSVSVPDGQSATHHAGCGAFGTCDCSSGGPAEPAAETE